MEQVHTAHRSVQKNPEAGNRLASMFIDHFIMSFAAMIFAIPAVIPTFIRTFDMRDEPTPDLFGNAKYFILIGYAVYFCKDSIHGRSPAKRIFKMQVVNHNTGQPASPLRCLARNLFCILWPIEVIVGLANPSRRIGDFVAGTRVVLFDPAVQPVKINWGQIAAALIIAYAFILLLFLPFDLWLQSMTRVQ